MWSPSGVIYSAFFGGKVVFNNDKITQTSKLERWISRSEIPMLVLALFAVIIYMADLLRVWSFLGVSSLYTTVAFIIDITFVVDLILKIVASGRTYLSSPWLVVDLIAAMPILGSMPGVPSTFQGLRFIRSVRLFRALRTLRILQAIPILQLSILNQNPTSEMNLFRRVMWIVVPAYAALFLGLVSHLYGKYGDEARFMEFYLLLGSLLSMFLVIAVVRYLFPALISLQVHGLLNVALPRQVVDYFLKHPESYTHTVRMPATILFCDIKNFTTTVERIGGDLNTLKLHLERVMDAVTEVHRKYDLIIDKFIGDAIMSFRGGDLVEGNANDHAYRVVKAAIESHKMIRSLDDPYFHDMKIGGASSDAVLIGAFGTSSRLSYTVLGDRVNLAARLESAVKQCGTQNLFCDITYKLLKEREDLFWRRFGRISVEGKNESLDIYEAFNASDIQDPSWIGLYHAALVDFEMQRFVAAQQGFRNVNELRPDGDAPSRRYVDYCQKLIDHPPAPDWVPIFTTYK